MKEGGGRYRGRAWSKRERGGGVGGRELRRREVGRLGQGKCSGGEEGGKDGREGDTNDQCQAWLCT